MASWTLPFCAQYSAAQKATGPSPAATAADGRAATPSPSPAAWMTARRDGGWCSRAKRFLPDRNCWLPIFAPAAAEGNGELGTVPIHDVDGDGRADILWADAANHSSAWTPKLAQSD